METTENPTDSFAPRADVARASFLIAHIPAEGAWRDRCREILATGAVALIDQVRDGKVPEGAWLRVRPGSAILGSWGQRTLVVSQAAVPTDIFEFAARLRAAGHLVGVEVTTTDEAAAAQAAGAAFIVARGLEAGGFISENSIGVLLRAVRDTVTIPVVAWGGAGVDTTAALRLLGAAGVVFSDQLLLAADAPTHEGFADRLRSFNPADTVQLGRTHSRRLRVYGQLGTRPPRELGKLERTADAEGFWAAVAERLTTSVSAPDIKTALVPLGQDAALASILAGLGSTARILDEVAAQTERTLAGLCADYPLADGAGIASVNRTALPIHQGPMAQTSDTPAFALAVAEAGGMPWLALGNMPPHVAEATIAQTKALLGDRPFGAGIIGLDANPHRDAHIDIMARLRPDFALVAAGTAEQALTVEKRGIPAYLHTPTPGLLRGALKSGCRRFILEGSEAGGHIGEIGGLLLWQLGVHAMLDAFDDGVNPADCAFVPAGGIGDASSAAAAAAALYRLHRLGVRCGVQMGTAYLLTDEIVSSGALSKGFQRCALDVRRTVLMGESVRTPTRVLETAEAQRVLDREAQREIDGVSLRHRKEEYEHDNLGGLRAAAKAQRIARIDPERGAIFEDLTTAEQEDKGLFHAGQIVAVTREVRSIAALHDDIAVAARHVEPAAPLATQLARIQEGFTMTQPEETRNGGVAIIGVGAVLPGASDVSTFWQNLLEGRDAIGEIPKDRWDADLYFSDDRKEADKTYSRIGGFIRGYEFDRKAFRLPPTVAGQMDLTQKLALSATRAALEDAGYLERDFDRERTAVVVGAARGDSDSLSDVRAYYPLFGRSVRKVLGTKLNGELEGVMSAIETDFKRDLKALNEDTMPGELDNIIAGRIAATFDLRGPNFTTDAACASSMAALEVAFRGLQDGRFDMAVTGGVDCMMAPPAYIKFSKIGALSARHSAPFDVEADGFVMGEGAAILLLKREEDAIRDGDRIYAVIRGIGGSSDGKGKGITAPNPAGQELAVERALEDAGVTASSIGMVEAHGTGTRVGDRVEVGVLRKYYDRDSFGHDVALGSVKSNIGHLKGASGAAGVVKAALSVFNGLIPPTLNVRNPNPALELEKTPFYLPTTATPWPEGAPRRAAVSSFGFGGTNFHVILEAPGTAVASAEARPTAIRGTTATSASAPLVAEAVMAAPAVGAGGPSRAAAYATILEILCARTGYDAEEIEPDFELEADLGIDTVKQAEIMASVREHYGLARDEDFRLADFPTLGHLAEYVVGRSCGSAPSVPVDEAATSPAVPVVTASEVGSAGPTRSEAYATILDILCARTGYDADEIEPDFELEADLGIDTVKQAEIMASVREHYGLARDESFRLADFPTLGHLADYVVGRSAGSPAAVAPVDAPTAEARSAAIPAATQTSPASAAELGYAPIVLTAVDRAGLSRAALALAAAPQSALDAARQDGPGTAERDHKVRLAVAAEDADTARGLLGKASAALDKGKGLRALENRGVFVRDIAETGKVAFLFPGQGSQYAGMLEDLRGDFMVVEETFAEADAAVADLFPKPLSAYMNPDGVLGASADRKSAEEALRQTQITQPAMVAADIAILRLLRQFGLRADVVGGHSLGEYAAAVAAGVMSFSTGLRTVAARGDAMAGANPGDAGLMAAMAAPAEAVQAVLDTVEGYVVCANKNCHTQTVIAGSTDGVEEALRKLSAAGIDGRLIPVSHAFHSKIVSGACGPLGDHLRTQEIKSPSVPIITNVTADYYPADPDAIRDILTVQLASPVEFVKMVERMHDDGARIFVEVGPKRALTGFVGSVLEGRPHRAYLSNHPKKGGRQTLRELLAALAAEGLLFQADEGAQVAQPSAKAAPTEVRRARVAAATPERPRIVISGMAVGLPGTEKVFGEEDAYDAILAGRNLIGQISEENKRKVVQKSIRRLQKGPSGGEFVKVERTDEVPQLAGMLGEFDLTEDFGVPAGLAGAMDRASQLALGAALDALRDAGLPLAPDFRVTRNGSKVRTGFRLPPFVGGKLGVIFASAFTGYDRLIEDVRAAALAEAGVGEFEFDRKFLLKVLGMGNAQVAEYIGARGPNTQMNSACASTTIALSMAEDWIRLGRADRVLIVGADDITSDGMIDWFTAGFLAAGAATTESDVTQAAVPFDKRRNGMIVGAGAVALVVERDEDVAARGMEPIADLLATRIANSAFHPTRLEVDHIAGEVEELLADAEDIHGIDRQAIAASTMFMSHETYTPARGGSAAAEIAALRKGFGEAANQVVIANTKGFSGHPMAAGIEDAIALKALQRGKVPPIANFRDPDPDLGDLRLSDGSEVDVRYALRLAAGFGSQLGLALFARRAQTENRVVDEAAWQSWLAACADAPAAEAEVVQRTLRVRPRKPAKLSVAPRVESNPVASNVVTPPMPGSIAATSAAATMSAQPDVSAAAPVPALGSTLTRESVYARILGVLCERTGYDADEVEPEFELEADLGIDTVKQAEIMATVREVYGLARDEDFRLADYPTLAGLTQYVLDRGADVQVPRSGPTAAAVAATTPAPVVLAVDERFAPRQVAVVPTEASPVQLEALAGQKVWLVGHGEDVNLLRQRLGSLGAQVLANGAGYDSILNVRTSNEDPESAALATFGLAKGFKTSGAAGFFLTVTRAGGRFGTDGVVFAPQAAAASGVTRSLARELPDQLVRTIDVDDRPSPNRTDLILAEALRRSSETDVGVRGGQRFVVRDLPLTVGEGMGLHIGPESVVLLTGGAGGITALVAEDFARRFGCRLALLGRTPLTRPNPLTIDLGAEKAAIKSSLEAAGQRVTPMAIKRALRPLVRQQEIAQTIERLRSAGATVEYFAADLADEAAVTTAVGQVREVFGGVDVLIHGAGIEISRLTEEKSEEEFKRVFRGKALGALTLWRLLGANLRAFVGFSSVAGRYGNVGQTDYTAANGLLARLTQFIDSTTTTTGLCIDWTAWDDVGMATQGSMRDILTARGVELLPAALGAPMVADLLTRGAHGEVLIAGALGDLAPTPPVTPVSLPTERCPMLEGVRAFAQGEAVHATRTLRLETDHFLRGHIYDGQVLMPGVMGLELMTEAASILFPELSVLGADGVEFLKALKLHRGEPVDVDVHARALTDGVPEGQHRVECSVQTRRTTKTGRVIETEHYRGTVRMAPRMQTQPVPMTIDTDQTFHPGPDKAAIYERMFHTGLFEVLERAPLVGESAVLARGRQPRGPLTDGGRNEDFLAAPLVVEMALQAAGLWGMKHHAFSYLPVGIGSIRYHGAHVAGEEIALRVLIHEGTTEGLRASVEARTVDGELVVSLSDIELIGHRPASDAERFAPTQPLRTLHRTLGADEAVEWLERLDISTDDLLSEGEQASWNRLRSAHRRREWLAARVLAKDIAREYLRDFYGVSLALADIEIAHHERGEPYAHVRSLLHAGWDVALPAISLTHSAGVAGVSIALRSEVRPGIDFEKIETRSATFIRDNFEPSELQAVIPGATTEAERITALWALKEATTKALGKGLALSTLEVVVQGVDPVTGRADIALRGQAEKARAERGGRSVEATVRLSGGFAVAEVALICEPGQPSEPVSEDVDDRIAAVAALLFHAGLLRPGRPS